MTKLNHWRTLIENTPEGNINNLSRFSQNWPSCAVGEKLGFPCNTRHELDDLLREHDEKLYDLGIEFYNSVQRGDKVDALKALSKIERHRLPVGITNNIGNSL